MRIGHLAALLAVLLACLPPLDEQPPPPPPPPPTGGGPPPPPPPPPPSPPPTPTDACGGTRKLDPGGHGGFPGSGVGNDGGTGQLWLVRIDRGTANLADSIQLLIQRTTTALAAAGLKARGISILSLYDGFPIWSTTDASSNAVPWTTIAGSLRARAGLDAPAPDGCATSRLLTVGQGLAAAGGFGITPGALLVAIVDHGARPVPIASCGDPAASLAQDPACWAVFGNTVLHRADFRFAFFATPETGTTAQMKASCLAVPGFPTDTLDSLEASDQPYYDPLDQEMDAQQPALATRFDLCNALGSGAPAQLAAFASSWAALLSGQP
jgi:hypothetical protein